METAKIFANGKSQAVRLPKECRFPGTEVYAQKIGDAVLLLPKDKVWETFMKGLDSFSSDFFAEGRVQNSAFSSSATTPVVPEPANSFDNSINLACAMLMVCTNNSYISDTPSDRKERCSKPSDCSDGFWWCLLDSNQ